MKASLKLPPRPPECVPVQPPETPGAEKPAPRVATGRDVSDDLWTMIGRGLAQASADECIDSPLLLKRGRFRSLAAEVGELTVVVATVVLPKGVLAPEQVASVTAEAVRRAMAGGKEGA